MATLSSTPAMRESNAQSFVKEPINQSINQANEAERDMQQNRIPVDKEDPSLSTKALPFASTNEQECEDLIKSGEEPSIEQSSKQTTSRGLAEIKGSSIKQTINQGIDQAKGAAASVGQSINQSMEGHNGNVLDRTMDQIRGWVHSFKTEPQYEEYEIEVDEDEQSAGQSIKQSAQQASTSAKSTYNQAAGSAKQSINEASQSINQATDSAKQSAAKASASAKSSLNQVSESAKSSLNQASASVKQTAAQASESAKQTAANVSESAKQTAASASQSAKQTAAQASESAKQAANQASNKLGQMKDSAADSVNQLSSQASNQAKIAQSKLGSLKDQVVNTVSDLGQSVSQTVNEYSAKLHDTYDSGVSNMPGINESISKVKSTVNEFVASHPSISQGINENIPSMDSINQSFSQSGEAIQSMLPPLAQQASSSWAFAGSFIAQYVANMKDYMLALRRQNIVVLAFTALTFVNHFVLPWFFLDKSAARSVIYSYVLASLAAHFTFFVSGHLRYQWLGHLLFVPMVLSLFFNQGFREAGDVSELIDSFKNGDRFGTAFAAPFSLRSYLFVLWMRGILMNQAVLGTLDLVNIMDLLGLNMDTKLGEEMPLIQGSVKNFRRSLAASVHGAADTLDVNAPAASHRGHGRKRRGSAQSNQPSQQQPQQQQSQQRIQKSSSPAPQQQQHAQSSQSGHQQHWVKKQSQESHTEQSSAQPEKMLSDKPTVQIHIQPKSDDSVRIESHERSSNELRQRHSTQSTQ